MVTAPRRRRECFGPATLGRLTCHSLFLACALLPATNRAYGQPEPAAALAEATQQGEEDEASRYRPGLVARYSGSDGVAHARLEEQLAFNWRDDPPDPRVARGPFTAQFVGLLNVRSPGTYRLRVFAAGAVRLELAGKLLLDGSSREPAWLDAEEIELPFGYHPLEVHYRRTDEPARIALYWEGPQFVLEPTSARWLFHETDRTPSDDFERGGRWVRALGCADCHDLQGQTAALAAPALNALAGNLARAWLVDRLAAGERPDSAENRARRRMPHFDFARQDAEAIADELFASSDTLNPQSPEVAPSAEAKPAPSAKAGAVLFRSLGCLACHRVGGLGGDSLFGGGELDHVADKRPSDYFARWLADPAVLNRDHRMPVFALDHQEISSLALYLQSLGSGKLDNLTAAGQPSQAERNHGRELIRKAQCGNCHALPKSIDQARNKSTSRINLAALAREGDHCLGEPNPHQRRPGYRLAAADRRAVATYLSGLAHRVDAPMVARGDDLLAEHQCLACHARGASPGLSPRLTAVAETDPALAVLLPALSPPSLSGVGDKLRDEALAAAIAASGPRQRTWLRVQMPKFRLSDDEARALADHLVEVDRIPERAEAERSATSPDAGDAALEAAGARLVTADGFGCTSCHPIGAWTPQKVALNAQGASLSRLGTRIRREWFDRWVRNPARIVPQMEMPAVQQSVRGVLSGNLERQLSAVWQVLNQPDFTPPSPSALRVVRRANLPGLAEPAAVLTDVIEVNGRPHVKPLVVGLANRHNVLFDLATNRLAAWWIGDTARQQTRGKSWYWEAGIPQLLPAGDQGAVASELALVRNGRTGLPLSDGQYLTEFDLLEHVGGGIRFAHRLRFGAKEQPLVLRVEQTITALAGDAGWSGFRRRFQVDRFPEDASCELVVLAGPVALDSTDTSAMLDFSTRLKVVLRSPSGTRLTKDARGAILKLSAASAQPISCTLDYLAALVPDEFAPFPQPDRSALRQELNVVPGFEAVRLPLTDQAMPTGLAWRDDGTLIVSSLEGRVWLGSDTDGDGWEDRLDPFSDELAAPYGVAANGDSIDVINKYGLLRLTDTNGDRHADRTQLLASGWGHTLDYHDWAIGLPRDASGNYYVSLPCQQDDRSLAAATLRGTIVKLVKRAPTDDDPRPLAIERVCGGLRFSHGLALSRAGDLFVTDNQGNYTPFNELNHIVPGARYGFLNRLESKGGLNPPFRPAAIEIPHPWTRSVNGICFLETPAELGRSSNVSLFGPFEGHLIGCEYDTRRLVRMSLERVGDHWQGAVYPFSTEPAAGEETFEGPLVCQVAPDGDLYVGNIRDSGWGAGANTGSIVQLRACGAMPPGIAAVRLARDGFAIDFTTPVDRARAADAVNYAISSYRRVPTPAYGAADQDGRTHTIQSIEVSKDGRLALVRLDALREGFVYEFHLRNLAERRAFFPAEAYYTLRHRVP